MGFSLKLLRCRARVLPALWESAVFPLISACAFSVHDKPDLKVETEDDFNSISKLFQVITLGTLCVSMVCSIWMNYA